MGCIPISDGTGGDPRRWRRTKDRVRLVRYIAYGCVIAPTIGHAPLADRLFGNPGRGRIGEDGVALPISCARGQLVAANHAPHGTAPAFFLKFAHPRVGFFGEIPRSVVIAPRIACVPLADEFIRDGPCRGRLEERIDLLSIQDPRRQFLSGDGAIGKLLRSDTIVGHIANTAHGVTHSPFGPHIAPHPAGLSIDDGTFADADCRRMNLFVSHVARMRGHSGPLSSERPPDGHPRREFVGIADLHPQMKRLLSPERGGDRRHTPQLTGEVAIDDINALMHLGPQRLSCICTGV